jgi:hypothetical protein
MRSFPSRGTWEIDYGSDEECGWFIQLYPLDSVAENYMYAHGEEECIDLDGMFDGFSGYELGYILKLFGGNKEHIDSANLDCEF